VIARTQSPRLTTPSIRRLRDAKCADRSRRCEPEDGAPRIGSHHGEPSGERGKETRRSPSRNASPREAGLGCVVDDADVARHCDRGAGHEDGASFPVGDPRRDPQATLVKSHSVGEGGRTQGYQHEDTRPVRVLSCPGPGSMPRPKQRSLVDRPRCRSQGTAKPAAC